VELKTN